MAVPPVNDPQNAYRQRDGMGTLINVAKTACRIFGIWEPAIRANWGGKPAVIALVNVISQICPLVGDAVAEYEQARRGGLNSDIVPPTP